MNGLSPGRRVLVTGARGFIGHHLVSRLVSSGAHVHAVSRQRPPAGEVSWWQVDLHDPQATQQLVQSVQPDVMFHLASTVTGSRGLEVVLPTLRDNLVAAVNLLAAAAAVAPQPRVVLAGSVEEPRAGEELVPPSSPYAAAKWATTAYARMFSTLWSLPVVVLRIAMVYGPQQADLTKLVPYVITSLHRQQAPKLTDGTREIDWIYVDDVVDAFLCAGSSDRATGHAIDIGSGTAVTIRQTVQLLHRLAGSTVAPEFGALPQRPQDTSRIADTGPAKDLLGWSASTALEEGMAATVRWYRDHPSAP